MENLIALPQGRLYVVLLGLAYCYYWFAGLSQRQESSRDYERLPGYSRARVPSHRRSSFVLLSYCLMW